MLLFSAFINAILFIVKYVYLLTYSVLITIKVITIGIITKILYQVYI